MNNCLVTKLKGVVDNDNLNYLGWITINKLTGGVSQLIFKSQTLSVTCKIVGEGYFTNSTGTENYGKELTITHSDIGVAYFYVSGDVRKLLVKNDESLVNISIRDNYNPQSLKMNVEDLAYITSLKNFELSKTPSYGDISKLKGSYLRIAIWETDIHGNLYDVLQRSLNILTQLQLNTNVTIEGSLSPIQLLSQDTILESINTYTSNQISGNFELLGNTNINSFQIGAVSKDITGSIEQFVANKRSSGRTEGSLSFIGTNYTAVTYNNSPITNNNVTVTWTADSITVV